MKKIEWTWKEVKKGIKGVLCGWAAATAVAIFVLFAFKIIYMIQR